MPYSSSFRNLTAPLSLGARLAVIALVTGIGAAWLLRTGPVPVIRITRPLPEMAPFWYMVLAFPVLGMLVADLVEELCAGLARPATWLLASQTAILILVSNLRLGVRLPISGHAALFSFFVVYRLSQTRDGVRRVDRVELLVALALLLVVAFVKLVWWTDAVTLATGVIFGGVVAVAGTRLAYRLDHVNRR